MSTVPYRRHARPTPIKRPTPPAYTANRSRHCQTSRCYCTPTDPSSRMAAPEAAGWHTAWATASHAKSPPAAATSGPARRYMTTNFTPSRRPSRRYVTRSTPHPEWHMPASIINLPSTLWRATPQPRSSPTRPYVSPQISRGPAGRYRVYGHRPTLASPATRPWMLKQNPALLPRLLRASTPVQPRHGCLPNASGNCALDGPRNFRMPDRGYASQHTYAGTNGSTQEHCGASIAPHTMRPGPGEGCGRRRTMPMWRRLPLRRPCFHRMPTVQARAQAHADDVTGVPLSGICAGSQAHPGGDYISADDGPGFPGRAEIRGWRDGGNG
jgi:hypothetical protein